VTLLCISLNAAAAAAADWPCFLGAHRDNTSADRNLKLWSGDSPKVLWKKNVGAGHSCMTVAGKQLYTQGEGAVWCLDTETGDLVWRYPPTGHGGENTSTPAVAGGLAIYTLAKGEPVAKYKWATDYNIATPIVSADKIFISGTGRGCFRS
jgi:outer membrane protein assembly factor BamB